jgi:hypothetical protein
MRGETAMPKAWKMIAYIQRLGSGKPLKNISDRDAAVEALRIRKDLVDAQIEVLGQATSDFVDWLEVKSNEIFCIAEGGQDYVPRRHRLSMTLNSVPPESTSDSSLGVL